MHPNSTHFPVPLYLPFTLTPKENEKTKLNQTRLNQPNKTLFPLSFLPLQLLSISLVTLGAMVCHTAYPLSCQLYFQMFVSVSHRSGSRPLVSGTPLSPDLCRNSSRIFCDRLESWMYCVYYSAGPVPSQAPASHRSVDIRVG